MADLARVHAALLGWYDREARDLPWRRTRDPYAILVAEVMLQQTQVDRVIPKWQAWLERFPSVDALAAAPRSEAIRAWEGLGYNLRAVRLHAIACQTVLEFGGQLPRSVEGLLRLKGIGPYTAGAVACFAYEQPVGMVDTNVRRVLSRVFGVSPSHVERVAESVLARSDPWTWNQALMDLGATLCRARQPLCLVCPLLRECAGPQTPARRKAKASGAQPFKTSNRYVRGRILDDLRHLETVPLAELAARHGERRDLIERLIAEGLLQMDDSQAVRLVE